MYLNLLSDVHGRPQSNKAHGANRMQVIGVGTNWYLIAVVGCSFSELHGRHTVHETICAWAAQGADVCFSILFSTFDVSHQANITVVFFSRSEQEREKMSVFVRCQSVCRISNWRINSEEAIFFFFIGCIRNIFDMEAGDFLCCHKYRISIAQLFLA